MAWGQKKKLWMNLDCERTTFKGTGSNNRLGADIASKKGCISVDVRVQSDGEREREWYTVSMHEWGGTGRAAGQGRGTILRGFLDDPIYDHVHNDTLIVEIKKRLADPNKRVEMALALSEILGTDTTQLS